MSRNSKNARRIAGAREMAQVHLKGGKGAAVGPEASARAKAPASKAPSKK